MKQFFIAGIMLMAAWFAPQMQAGNTDVRLLTDSYTEISPAVLEAMQNNLATLLDEINAANSEGRALQLSYDRMPQHTMSQEAKGTLQALWDNVHFYCPDSEIVVDRVWPLQKTYMVRQIPLIMNPQGGEDFATGTYQEATVDFDKTGRIVDFYFVFDSQQAESMERGGKVVDLERRIKILKFCDRFATWYSTKNIDKLTQIFSDDALIITGNVTQVYDREGGALKPKVTYKKQNKQEYLANLRRAFARNKYIKVEFNPVGERAVTQSLEKPNFYGVRLHQAWRSSNYNDDGYVFLLWEFLGEDDYILHVRTWQPEYLDAAKTQALPTDDIFSLSDFDL
ncbi:MAG: hypothetical protein J6M19_03480 [Bacteroidaceae bacterium]|nr:hypothetical protein [Bacteroidaceae bacterium]